ncbi:hypothetical protein [Wolbachia endosymbiont of Brugia pahangi]|nr:hypothetical protein [Wolbachia endosymbiont of Brugia pahangi]
MKTQEKSVHRSTQESPLLPSKKRRLSDDMIVGGESKKQKHTLNPSP